MKKFKVVLEGLVSDRYSTMAESSEEVFKKLEEKYVISGFVFNDTIYCEVLNIRG